MLLVLFFLSVVCVLSCCLEAKKSWQFFEEEKLAPEWCSGRRRVRILDDVDVVFRNVDRSLLSDDVNVDRSLVF